MLVDEGVAGTRPAHIDLNFGCPVPKVTRKGGGSALPWRRVLFGDIVRAAVRAAGDVPVTVKTRIGIDADHVTYLDAGRIAQDEGAAAITLHGRTADQLYSGTADWSPIARLVEAVDIPVLGNGDIWEADDALRMVAETGCAGVVVGRGCLGRPWLFGDLAAAFAGATRRALPTLREVAAIMHRHAELLAAEHGERHGCTDFRKHVAWYLKGFSVGSDVRRALAMVSGLDELADLLARIPDQPYPVAVLGAPARPDQPAAAGGAARGLAGRPRRPAAAGGRRAGGERRMTNGPFLYDDGPAPLHTGTPRRRPWLLLAIFGGTAVVAVLMVLGCRCCRDRPTSRRARPPVSSWPPSRRATPRPRTGCSATRSGPGWHPTRSPRPTSPATAGTSSGAQEATAVRCARAVAGTTAPQHAHRGPRGRPADLRHLLTADRLERVPGPPR